MTLAKGLWWCGKGRVGAKKNFNCESHFLSTLSHSLSSICLTTNFVSWEIISTAKQKNQQIFFFWDDSKKCFQKKQTLAQLFWWLEKEWYSERPSNSGLYFLSILSFIKSKSLILNPRLDEASLFWTSLYLKFKVVVYQLILDEAKIIFWTATQKASFESEKKMSPQLLCLLLRILLDWLKMS